MPKLVLVRHGESIWNAEDRFTGWVNVPLSKRGEQEARDAGERLRGIPFDVAYTSDLCRAADTLTIILQTLGSEVPVISDWRLKERDYGELSGLNKQATREKYSDEIVHVWRRSFDIPPPGGEALKDTAERCIPFFERAILGDIKQGKGVLVAAHGNSNRAIVMRLDGLSGDEVMGLELATGVPIVYELSEDGEVESKRTLD